MQSKSLIGLTLAALVAASAALWLSVDRDAPNERASGEPLIPGLTEQLNEITEVRVEDAEEDSAVTLVRMEQGWGVAERGGFPVELTDLRRQLIALGEATLAEAKTANPEHYAQLGVQDPQEEGATSKLITLALPDGPVSIIVGRSNFRGLTTTYVRRAGEAQSWAATGNIGMDATPQDWLRKDLIDIGSPQVRRVELIHPDGDRVELLKATRELPNHGVANLPEGRELLSPSAGNSIASALSALRLEDVLPASDFDPADQEPVLGVWETFDGLRIRTRAWQTGDDERYVALTVEYDPELVVEPASDEDPAAADEESTEADSEAEAENSDAESAAAEATELQARLDGWVFRIPSYKYSNMTKRLDDLLKPLEAASEEAS